jgi:DNA-binding NtrC family response regulator
LRNTLERAVIACKTDVITAKHLPPGLVSKAREEGSESSAAPIGVTLEEAEKTLIRKTLASVNNNKTRAADILGISLKTLHNKLHRYGV